jgi:hypothetical protein
VVVKAAPFQSITDAATNSDPDTVIVSAPLPAVAEFGVTLLIEGTGFCWEEMPWDPPDPPQASAKQMNSSKRTERRRYEWRQKSKENDIEELDRGDLADFGLPLDGSRSSL